MENHVPQQLTAYLTAAALGAASAMVYDLLRTVRLRRRRDRRLTGLLDGLYTAVLGLLLRSAVADGKLTDEELLSVQPALECRVWQPGISVQVGDVYACGGFLWRCIQAHTTQSDWLPDKVPALWHKVEIVHEDEVRVWQAGVNYAAGDEVAYPDANGTLYACLQGHTALAGWEPPNVPALWKAKTPNEPAPQIALN